MKGQHEKSAPELKLPEVRDLRNHRWVWRVKPVSVDYKRTVIQVHFHDASVPEFILQSDAFDVLEVFVDNVPPGWAQTILGAQRARRWGWGKTAITALVEVDAE